MRPEHNTFTQTANSRSATQPAQHTTGASHSLRTPSLQTTFFAINWKVICIGRCVDARKLLFVWRFWLRFHATDENYDFFLFHFGLFSGSGCVSALERKIGWQSDRIEDHWIDIDTVRIMWTIQPNAFNGRCTMTAWWMFDSINKSRGTQTEQLSIAIGTQIYYSIDVNGWFGCIFLESNDFRHFRNFGRVCIFVAVACSQRTQHIWRQHWRFAIVGVLPTPWCPQYAIAHIETRLIRPDRIDATYAFR